MNFSSQKLSFKIDGFTIIELTVSMAIIGVLSTIFMFNYPDTANRARLSNSAERILFDIKEAQVKGVSISNYIAGNDTSITGYGVTFEKNNPKSYALFQDLISLAATNDAPYGIPVGDGIKGGSINGVSEETAINTLPDGFQISDICVLEGTSSWLCSQSSSRISRVDISFTRPRLTAHITKNSSISPSDVHGAACVTVKAMNTPSRTTSQVQYSHFRHIIVEEAGRTYMRNGTCECRVADPGNGINCL